MTMNQSPFPADETSAADRVRTYLGGYKRMKSLDQTTIHAVGIDGVLLELSVADLECLVQQADSLRHYNPFTHRNIEAQHTGLAEPVYGD